MRQLAGILLVSSISMALSVPVLAARNEHRPVCAPDGSRMIFMLQSERTADDWELYLMDMESQEQSRLTNHPGWDGYAVWSPDGTRIIFDREPAPEQSKQPWMMQLADRTSKPLGTYEGWMSISDWSAVGQLLGFHELDGQRDLVLLNLDGVVTRKLTNTPKLSEHDAHFSPDGLSVAFASSGLEGSETTLELIELETGEREVLHTSIGRIYGLTWAPDGSGIAYVDAPGGEDDDADVFVYTFSDKSIRQVTDNPSWDHMPEYCNSPHTMFFTSYRSGEERIYRIDPDPQPYLKLERGPGE